MLIKLVHDRIYCLLFRNLDTITGTHTCLIKFPLRNEILEKYPSQKRYPSHGLWSSRVKFYQGWRVGTKVQFSLIWVAPVGERQARYTLIALTNVGVFTARDICQRNNFEKAYAKVNQICWIPLKYCLLPPLELHICMYSGYSGISTCRSISTGTL